MYRVKARFPSSIDVKSMRLLKGFVKSAFSITCQLRVLLNGTHSSRAAFQAQYRVFDGLPASWRDESSFRKPHITSVERWPNPRFLPDGS